MYTNTNDTMLNPSQSRTWERPIGEFKPGKSQHESAVNWYMYAYIQLKLLLILIYLNFLDCTVYSRSVRKVAQHKEISTHTVTCSNFHNRDKWMLASQGHVLRVCVCVCVCWNAGRSSPTQRSPVMCPHCHIGLSQARRARETLITGHTFQKGVNNLSFSFAWRS